MNPDEIPLWFAGAASVALCIVWRRQVILDRRRAYTVLLQPYPPVSARSVALAHESTGRES